MPEIVLIIFQGITQSKFWCFQVFPQVLRYNRLTGAFEEVFHDGSSRPSSKYDGNSSLPYGVTDDERDAMLQWARKERLPLFLRYLIDNYISSFKGLHVYC